MKSAGVPTEPLDIDREAAPHGVTIQFTKAGERLWVHLNGRTILRIDGIGQIVIENAHDGEQRVDLTWDVPNGSG